MVRRLGVSSDKLSTHIQPCFTVPTTPSPRGRRTMQDVLDDPDKVFQLLHPLGRGSYGAVYKARVISTGEVVAVKVIPLAADDEIESIQREIAMLRDCKHPNIVKYYVSGCTACRSHPDARSTNTGPHCLHTLRNGAGKRQDAGLTLDCHGVLRRGVCQRYNARELVQSLRGVDQVHYRRNADRSGVPPLCGQGGWPLFPRLCAWIS